MKAVKLTGPKQLSLVEIDKPASDGISAIISVANCGICGSDLHYWAVGIGMDGRPGLVLGHEFAGVLEDAGGRDDLRPGDRVTAIPLNPCGECVPCRQDFAQLCTHSMKRPILGNNAPGAYAEHVSVPPGMVRRLPDSTSDLSASMIEPSAVSLRAVRMAGIQMGHNVLIVGGGTIGLLCAAWSRISGAATIRLAEVNCARIEAAGRLGDVDEVLDAKDPNLRSKIKKAVKGGFDAAIDTSASDAGIGLALTTLKPRGTLVLAGISFLPQPIQTLAITAREITVRGSMAYQIQEFDSAMNYIAMKKLEVEKYISRTVGFGEVQDAFKVLSSGASADVKIVIKP